MASALEVSLSCERILIGEISVYVWFSMLFDNVYISSDDLQMACCSLCEVFQYMIVRLFYSVFNGNISDISCQMVNVEYSAR